MYSVTKQVRLNTKGLKELIYTLCFHSTENDCSRLLSVTVFYNSQVMQVTRSTGTRNTVVRIAYPQSEFDRENQLQSDDSDWYSGNTRLDLRPCYSLP